VIGLQTRALQVEIRLPNPHGELLPGAYVQVVLHTAPDAAGAVLKVPGNTLLFRPEGPCVAVVGASGRVHLQVVSIARELGVEVELSGGVGEHDRLIINPPDSLAEGDQVEVTVAAEKVKPAG
jgi:multidrug efflux pump subunit AcrA (membrane-fusion protein)